MNEIPTPRTDAEWNNLDGQWHERAVKLCHFTQELERELTTAHKQLLESESARNRNFQSASEAMETVAKLSAKLETTEKERDKLIQQEELVENAIPGGEFEGSEDTNGEIVATIVSQRDTALAELAKVKAELKQREDRTDIPKLLAVIDKLIEQRDVEISSHDIPDHELNRIADNYEAEILAILTATESKASYAHKIC